MSDPVLFPRADGSLDTHRQTVARDRAQLAETLAELTTRLDAKRIVRRHVRRLAPAVIAGTTVVIGGAVALRFRYGRIALSSAAASAAAVAALTWRSARASRPLPVLAAAPVSPADALLTADDNDVIAILIEQHRQIDGLIDRLRATPDGGRLERFAALVELVQKHERAEHRIVHEPLAKTGPEAAATVRASLDEESRIARSLADLIARGCYARSFPAGLDRLQRQLQAHAAREESDEFPLLRTAIPAGEARRMATEVRADQAGTW